MNPKGQPVSLNDLLGDNYEFYLNDEDTKLIHTVFNSNPRLLKVLRKVLLPSVGDLEMTMEEVGKDVWMEGIDWAGVPEKEIKPLAVGRQLAIKFIAGGLVKLRMIANQKVESPYDKAQREKKNSTK